MWEREGEGWEGGGRRWVVGGGVGAELAVSEGGEEGRGVCVGERIFRGKHKIVVVGVWGCRRKKGWERDASCDYV